MSYDTSLKYAADQLSVSTLLGLCLVLPKSSLKYKIVAAWNLFTASLSEQGSPCALIVVAVQEMPSV